MSDHTVDAMLDNIKESGLKTAKDLKAREREIALNISFEEEYRYTESGIAQLIHDIYKDQWFYLDTERSWYQWNGKFWEVDESLRFSSLVKTAVINLLTDAATNNNKIGREFYSKCCDTIKQKHIVEACKVLFAISPSKVNSELHYFPMENGTYDIRNHRFTNKHYPELYLTKHSPLVYNREADCPKWKAHLSLVFKGNEDMIRAFQELCGYTLLPTNPKEIFIILYGSGKNGKSVTLRVVKFVLGQFSTTAQVESIMKNKRGRSGETHRSDLVHIVGSRMVSVSEGNADDELAAGLIKQLTSGRDNVHLRGAYDKRGRDYSPGFKIWFVTNHLPTIDGADFALMRRIIPIAFLAIIDDKYRVDDYDTVLVGEEGGGIFNWFIEGLKRYEQRGDFIWPNEIISSINEYKTSNDNLLEWLEDRCILEGKYARNLLIDNYQEYCETNRIVPLRPKAFWSALKSRGIYTKIGDVDVYVDRLRGVAGIRLKTPEELTRFTEQRTLDTAAAATHAAEK